jgi:hypothetical protein
MWANKLNWVYYILTNENILFSNNDKKYNKCYKLIY